MIETGWEKAARIIAIALLATSVIVSALDLVQSIDDFAGAVRALDNAVRILGATITAKFRRPVFLAGKVLVPLAGIYTRAAAPTVTRLVVLGPHGPGRGRVVRR